MLYLIMRCDELYDQYDCDADRTPIAIVEDWKDWAKNHVTDYNYEVWQYDGNEFSCIKEYDEPLEEGMALYYWERQEDPEENLPHVIEKYPNATRHTKIPALVKKYLTNDNMHDIDDSLKTCGYITWYDENANYYAYGEYWDNNYLLGY